MVWDTDKPEELVVAPTSEHSHSEPITKVRFYNHLEGVNIT
jgi:hypothetical protein